MAKETIMILRSALSLFLIFPSLGTHAQVNPAASARLADQTDAPLQHRAPAPPDYILGAGDQITLHVADMEEIPTTPITLDPSGFIDLPLAGPIHAAGLTLAQLKVGLTAKLKNYITAPQVSVNLTSSGSQPVSVVGEVNNPGVHQLAGTRRLLEVLALSGGLRTDAGPDVLVTRAARWGSIPATGVTVDPANGATTATFSVDALLSGKSPAANIVMLPDDVVSVPRGDLIYVVGDVKKAGGFELSSHQSASLLHVLALAEGLGPDDSASHARILRSHGDGPPQEIVVDVHKILSGKAEDVRLLANDVLYIPRSGVKVTTRRVAEAAIGITTGLLIYR